MIPDLAAPAPLWFWLVAAALILAVEVATGTGWLLWAAASAATVGLLALARPMSFAFELGLFGVLTMASALLARRYLPASMTDPGPDINDNLARVVGRRARTTAAFDGGRGRVEIDGKEWPAELEDGGTLEAGLEIEVTAVDGVKLKVRPLSP